MEEKPKVGTALMKVSDIKTQFPVLVKGTSKALEIIQEQLDAEDITIFSLEKISVVPGGVKLFQIKSPSGKTTTVAKLHGVILLRRRMRAYWPDGQPLGQPPSCFSDDGKVGLGDISESGIIETRRCKVCPMAQFGSAMKKGKKKKGQGCQLRNVLFFLREGRNMPSIINAPPTSARAVQGFIMEKAGEEHYMHHLVTEFDCEHVEKNDDGEPYSIVGLTMVGVLDETLQTGANALNQAIKGLFSSTRIDAEVAQTILSDTPPEAPPVDDDNQA